MAASARAPRWWWLGLACVMAVLCADLASASIHRKLENGMVAVLSDDHELFLRAEPLRGEGWISFTRRLTGDVRHRDAIAQLNNRPRRLLADRYYKVPFALLQEVHQLRVIKAVFPEDTTQPGGWRHRVPESSRSPSLWQISKWFTGDGENAARVRVANEFQDYQILPGQWLTIPKHLLLPTFRSLVPDPPPVVAEATPPSSTPPSSTPPSTPPSQAAPPVIAQGSRWLSYGGEGADRYALYHLKRKEALYSAVVVRFTGRTFATDVNELAAELARLNGISDVKDMPVGQPIRIPLDLLLPEYLPADDPRRQEYDKNRSESAKYSNTVEAKRLEGITVILDAGHGGDDPGTNHKGVWESTYVYDVMLRVKKLLETTTAAKIRTTTRSGDSFAVPDRDVLPNTRRHHVLTNPPYAIADHRVSTHFRWYLANSMHRKAVASSKDPAKTVFLSIHADSLHRSLRGAMAYVPSTSLTSGEYGKSGSLYRSRKEVKEKPRVSFSWKERTRSEGLSRQLAEELIASFRRHGLAVHKEKPIRDRIIRCRRCRPFVPAVVRYNAVPTKLLFEICNMNNDRDRKLLTTRAFRQDVAEALVDGILAYFGQETGRPRVAEQGSMLQTRDKDGTFAATLESELVAMPISTPAVVP